MVMGVEGVVSVVLVDRGGMGGWVDGFGELIYA